MTLDEALTLAAARSLNTGDIASLVQSFPEPRATALDRIAVAIAERYLTGTVNFTVADALVNYLFAYGVTVNELPDLMVSIFLAFDSGEFVPPQDPPDTDPAKKYTIPLLRTALTRRSFAS